MPVRNLWASLGNRIWQFANRSEHLSFLGESAHLESVQRRLLQQSLRAYSNTLWGRRYQVTPSWSYERFCQEIPLHEYQDLLPFLQQNNGLCPHRVVRWEPTGGSTGAVKWIPWTGGLQAQFRRAVGPWINEMFQSLPDLRNGRSFWQLTPNTASPSPPWLSEGEAGFAHDGDYLGPVGRLLERMVLLSVDRRSDQFWESLVRALTGARDLRYISCWSPSYLLVLKERFEALQGPWNPARYWPRLQLLSCWTQGPSQALVAPVQGVFPQAEIVGKGLVSTEAVTTIPMLGIYPLAYRSHFFEFLTSDGWVLPAWELSEGEEYEVVHTTLGGLVRYRTGDLVVVTGCWRSIPCLEFVARRATCDHFGEKLSHRYLQRVLGPVVGFAALGFEQDGYILFLSEHVPAAEEAYRRIDEALSQVYTYRDCLELGQLKPLRCFVIEGDAAAQWGRLQPDPAAKWGVVLSNDEWSRRFRGRFLD